MTSGERRTRPWRWAITVIGMSLLGVASTGMASASGDLAHASRLKVVLALTPPRAVVAQNVTADMHRSTLPAGATLKRLIVSWGDGSKAVAVSSLHMKAVHKYSRRGKYVVRATLTDSKNKSATATQAESIGSPAGIYWDLFNGGGPASQLEHASLPLTTHSKYASISGTVHNKLRCTAGEASTRRAGCGS